MPSSSREEGKKSRLKIIIYGGFGGESGDDAVRAQLEQMAHPTDFGVRAHLHAFLAVLQRLAVEKDVAQMENCARCDREKQEQYSKVMIMIISIVRRRRRHPLAKMSSGRD